VGDGLWLPSERLLLLQFGTYYVWRFVPAVLRSLLWETAFGCQVGAYCCFMMVLLNPAVHALARAQDWPCSALLLQPVR
jgi:hypothetical protein